MDKISNSKDREDKNKLSDSERKEANRNAVPSIDNLDKKKSKTQIAIIFTISTICLIAILTSVLLIGLKLLKKDNNSVKYYPITPNDYENELSFTTKVNDLRRISIHQKTNENMIFNGIEMPTQYLKKNRI